MSDRWIGLKIYDRVCGRKPKTSAAEGEPPNWRDLAEQWAMSERPDSLLLTGASLQQALAWVARHNEEVCDFEQDFLAESREAESAASREKRSLVPLKGLGVVAILLALVTARLWLWSGEETDYQRGLAAKEAAARTTVEAAVTLQADEFAQAEATHVAVEAVREEFEAQAIATQEALATRAAERRGDANTARTRLLVAQAELVMEEDKELATLLALEAVYASARGSVAAMIRWMAQGVVYRALDYEGWDILFHNQGREVTLYTTWPSAGGQALILTSDDTALIWDIDEAKRVTDIQGSLNHVQSVSWSPDEQRFLALDRDGGVSIWSAVTGERELAVDRPGFRLTQAVWSSDGEQILGIDAEDGSVIWDSETGEDACTADLLCYRKPAAWSRNGKRLAAIETPSQLTIRDAKTGNRVYLRDDLPDAPSNVEWGYDDRAVAVYGDYYIRVWSTLSGTELGGGLDPALDPNWGSGPYWASGGLMSLDDGEHFYFVDVRDLRVYACDQLTRNMTASEWQRYVGVDVFQSKTCSNLP